MKEKGTLNNQENEPSPEANEAPSPFFSVQTPMGEFSVDMKEFADAKAAAYAMMPKQKRSNLFDSKMFTFLEAQKHSAIHVTGAAT